MRRVITGINISNHAKLMLIALLLFGASKNEDVPVSNLSLLTEFIPATAKFEFAPTTLLFELPVCLL